jgi:hypothetical protein
MIFWWRRRRGGRWPYGGGWMHLRVRARTKLRRGSLFQFLTGMAASPLPSPAIWSCRVHVETAPSSPWVHLSLTRLACAGQVACSKPGKWRLGHGLAVFKVCTRRSLIWIPRLPTARRVDCSIYLRWSILDVRLNYSGTYIIIMILDILIIYYTSTLN